MIIPLLFLALGPRASVHSIPQSSNPLVLQSSRGYGQQLLGADRVLRELKTPLPGAKGGNPASGIAAESDALRYKLSSLAPKAAAAAWVSLVRDWESRVPAQPENTGQPNGWADVMKALPEPEAWPAIREGLTKLPPAPTAPVIALMNDLLGNDAAVLSYLDKRHKEIARASAEATFPLSDPTSSGIIPLAVRTGNLDLVEKTILEESKGPEGDVRDEASRLLPLLGPKRAETVLRTIYESRDPSVMRSGVMQFGGPEMQRLARKIVVSDIAKLKAPVFELIEGPGDYSFVAVQVARF
ncbi:MAG TPA: hypothetical protein VMI31_16235, partial [Fimbriimonadaceae bacterium]|nr:hypothetical protein [Fimbriimonadaceae bacterium]